MPVPSSSESEPPLPQRPGTYIPDWLEERILDSLDESGDFDSPGIHSLLQEHPEYAEAARAWFAAATPPRAAPAPIPDPDAAEKRIGPYRLIRKLGKGGFGTVWLASQQEPIRREVALKILNADMDSEEVLARFSAEREALARMDHPCIARLLDAGRTEAGQPFVVMEYVEGLGIQQFAVEQGMPIDARLRLFLRVADAIHHAHQKGVIHRDISDTNVLVTELDGAPFPKVIDFGIAKSLSGRLTMESLHTLQGQFLGTPEFMSPEQAAGAFDDVDTRTDVYALGALLYQLLTDVLPVPRRLLRGKSKSWRDIEQVVREHAIVPPSQAVPDKRRERLLRGDLDWVTSHALAKDPDTRYGTVAEMRDDIERYLDGEPVEVGPPSRLYALRKFARRNRMQFTAAAVVFVGLAAALAVALAALQVARKETRRAEEIRVVADAKADAGFKLLADLTALQEARSEAQTMLPAWPVHRDNLRTWLANYGETLPKELDKMRAKLAEIEGRRPASHSTAQPVFATRDDRYLHGALQRLIDEFEAFVAADGLLPEMRARAKWATQLTDHAAADSGAAWEEAIASIKASPLYDHRRIEPQAGLHPLGKDPDSGLMEFVHLRSGAAVDAIPPRDAETGKLALGPHHGMVFVLIPGGDFWMGSRPTDPGLPGHDPWSRPEEQPSHKQLVGAFFLAKHEMHRAQWQRLVRRADTFESALDQGLVEMTPMTQVHGRSARDVLMRHGLDLPREAQWEYACRATTRTPWWSGATEETLRGTALCNVPVTAAPFQFVRVDYLEPNPFGLHNMHGNGAEWTRSPFTPYAEGDETATAVTPSEELWSVRGGSAFDSAMQCRSASRRGLSPDGADATVGIRPVRAVLNN